MRPVTGYANVNDYPNIASLHKILNSYTAIYAGMLLKVNTNAAFM